MIPRRKIIAISGKAGSGKDTLGRVFTSDYACVRFAMADLLKEETARCFNMSELCFHDRTRKDSPLPQFPVQLRDLDAAALHELVKSTFVEGHWTPRSLCILYGTMIRSVNPDYWVSTVYHQICQMPKGIPAVITDLRYSNEVEYLRRRDKKSIVFVHINRKELYGEDKSSSVGEHELEEAKHADVVFENSESLHQFKDIAQIIWSKFDE